MGAEGATWVGAQPLHRHAARLPEPGRRHLLPFGLSGDPPRRSPTNTNITYKILYNDAVAMTGGQPHDGNVHPWTISQQVHAEGARRIALVSDDPHKYPVGTEWAPGVTFHHRDELDEVQRELREWQGRLGADLRPDLRRREAPPPQARHLSRSGQARVHQPGGVRGLRRLLDPVELPQSVMPVETEFGNKRAIDQSSCNKDFSCLNGFCPSFVTVEGGGVRKGKADSKAGIATAEPPLPPAPALPVGRRQALRRADHRHRRHRRRHHRRHHGHGRPYRRQGRHRARPARHGAEGRRRHQPCPASAQRPRRCTPCGWAPAAPTCCWAATWS